MTFNPITFKKQFPLFQHPSNKELVYLDNAATTHKPASVIQSVSDFYGSMNANTDRSSHRLAREATEMVATTRELARQFTKAASNEEIIFNRGATEGLNFLAASLCQQLEEDDEIILSQAEHHANLLPWQHQAQVRGLKLKFIPFESGSLATNQISQLISARTKIISLTAASNTLGFLSDLASVKQHTDGSDILFIVDAAQLAAHQTLDVQELGCDFLVYSAHKIFGPSGIGVCYGRRSLLEEMIPFQFGGEMIDSVTLDAHSLASPPKRFEAGTLPLAEIAGLKACFEFWDCLNRESISQHEMKLTEQLHSELSQISKLQLLSTSKNNIGIANFAPAKETGLSASDVASLLDEQDIATRHGQHCTQPLMQTLGIDGSIRASISAYNSEKDIEKLIDSLKTILKLPSHVSNESGSSTDSYYSDDVSSLSIETLTTTTHWQARYKKILQWGSRISEKPKLRSDNKLVKGCESATWLAHSKKENRHYFALESDSRIVKGLGALLLSQINGRTTEEIETIDLEALFKELGLHKHLSPSRSNGFKAMVDAAIAYL